MDYKIVSDSSLDLNDELEKIIDVEQIPFRLYIDEEEIIDDRTLDVNNFIKRMGASKKLPRTACPSPNEFKDSFEGEKDIFAITISSKLSGTYNSASLAKNMILEEVQKNIHLFDSKSASVGQTLVALKIKEYIEKGVNFEGVVKNVEEYIANMKTYFIAESLENLIKNGRIPSWKGKLAMALKIRPIMTAIDGEIVEYEKVRSSKKAFERLAQIIKEQAGDASDKILAISHVNNLSRAESLKDRVKEICNFKEIIIVPTHGLTSLYCDDQGIILAF